MADTERVEFVETSIFTSQISRLLTDEEYAAFQTWLASNPDAGPLIRGGGGLRKARVAVGSRGKRGGARIIYYWVKGDGIILLLFAYAKNVAGDLTPQQISRLAAVVREEFGR